VSDLAALMREVVAALTVGERAFSWFGKRFGPAASSLRSLTRKQLQESLRVRLARHLYDHVYCRGFPAEAVPARRGPGFTASLADELSNANCGRGYDEAGWRVIHGSGSRMVVTRRGLTFDVPREHVHEAGGEAKVRFPRELRRISPGFYTALGNEPLPEDTGLLRVYWNLRPEGAIPFVRHATRAFNDLALPFRLKVVDHAAGFDRCDAGVLYVSARDRAEVYEVLPVLHRRLARALKPLTPVFAKQLAPGVALAESPAGNRSFGEHRSDVLASALIGHKQMSIDARLRAIVAQFRRHHLSFRRPFLNPRSADVYPPLGP
jgi:hypothetical protein